MLPVPITENPLQRAAAAVRLDAVKAKVADFPYEIQTALISDWRERVAPDAPAHNDNHRHLLAGINLQSKREDLTAAHVHLAFDEDSISAKAKRCAYKCLRAGTLDQMLTIVSKQGIDPPDEKHSEIGRVNRMRCEKWWRRKMHSHYSRRAEGSLRDLGLVNKKRGLYCSDSTLQRRQAQKSRQREMMKEVMATNDLGDQLTLFELSKNSISNPAIRRVELMTRTRGFEEVADAAGHVAEFFTFTTPSRFHSFNIDGTRNKNYAATLTPRDAQDWLCLHWARIRAKLNRLSIHIYGFRVAEPHHDGTCHWHVLLFMRSNQRGIVRAICRGHLLRDSGGEPGATQHRFRAVSIDPDKGSAAGYIAKYIAKNIDGFEVGEDFESPDKNASDTVARVEAWASTWGIRQFQQIGGPPVGIWRELRRIREPVEGEQLEAARAAADAGEWKNFIDAYGGIDAGRNGAVELVKEFTGEINRYDEMMPEQVTGVKAGIVVVLTRLRVWVFAFIESCVPWTRVNNCTADYEEYLSIQTAQGPP